MKSSGFYQTKLQIREVGSSFSDFFKAAQSTVASSLLGEARNNRVIRQVQKERLTYLAQEPLLFLANTVTEVERKGMRGVMIEAGCALGGSAIVIGSRKRSARPLLVFDTFGMIPAPSERDGEDVHKRYRCIIEGRSKGLGPDQYYGYQTDLLGTVQRNFQRCGLPLETANTSLIQGLYREILHVNEPVAFAHIDCDWYESVYVCLERIVPQLEVGGMMIIDDYYAWSGCRKATDEYFGNSQKQFEFQQGVRLRIERLSN
jgi:hypothetical protein